MASPVSRMPEFVDALLANLRDLAPTTIAVEDGPRVTGDTRPTIWVGHDGGPPAAGDYEAGESAQEWAGLGAKKRDETLTVNGACLAWQGGGSTAKEARDAAYALLAIVGEACHPLPSLGIQAPTWAGITSHTLIYEPDQQRGLAARIPWQITVRTRP